VFFLMPPFFLPSPDVLPDVFKIALNREKTVESIIKSLDSTALKIKMALEICMLIPNSNAFDKISGLVSASLQKLENYLQAPL